MKTKSTSLKFTLKNSDETIEQEVFVPHRKCLEEKKVNFYLTNKCQLDCIYCNRQIEKNGAVDFNELSSIELMNLIEAFALNKFTRIRFTSRFGDPLLRKDLEQLIKKSDSCHFSEISLTTNGLNLVDRINLLKDSGLDKISISVDTLNKSKYKYLTGRDKLNIVLKNLEKAAIVFKDNLKMNIVIIRGFNEDEVYHMIDWALERNITPQLIEYIGKNERYMKQYFYNLDEVIEQHTIRGYQLQEDKFEKRTTIFYPKGKKLEIRQSKKWPELYYLNERIAVHTSGYITNFMNEKTGLQPEEFNIDYLVHLLNKTHTFIVTENDINKTGTLGNRNTVC
ncbi:MAG: radical SAM protein [Ignavibacteria bacterium]|jgi:cyclic pyranopterin phosphate synthase